jgi:hypothetical protein
MARKRIVNVDALLATSHLLLGQDAPRTSTRAYHQERRKAETLLAQGKIFTLQPAANDLRSHYDNCQSRHGY